VARRSTAHSPVLQASLRRATARLRGEETGGDGVSSDDYQLGIAERIDLSVGFSIKHICPGSQAGAWSKSIQLEARP